mgnify:CR=1 FL=1|jgi:D-sedoheptulose 7-phosphate isomerase
MIDERRAREVIRSGIEDGVALRQELGATQADAIIAASDVLVECFKRGGKVLICGNGGSAADSQHIAAELTGRFERPARRALGAVALTTDTSALTAVANDIGFEEIFARQVDALGRAGDVLLALSTSGRSSNVVRATRRAASLRMTTIAITGPNSAELGAVADLVIATPGLSTARIQELHLTVGHLLCALVDEAFAP